MARTIMIHEHGGEYVVIDTSSGSVVNGLSTGEALETVSRLLLCGVSRYQDRPLYFEAMAARQHAERAGWEEKGAEKERTRIHDQFIVGLRQIGAGHDGKEAL